jgi:hypothetical protein
MAASVGSLAVPGFFKGLFLGLSGKPEGFAVALGSAAVCLPLPYYFVQVMRDTAPQQRQTSWSSVLY